MLDKTREQRQLDVFVNRPAGTTNVEEKIAGGYILKHQPTGKFYVGSSVDCARRVTAHVGQLRRGDHPVSELQSLYNEAPCFEVQLQPATVAADPQAWEKSRATEQRLLDENKSHPLLLNKAQDAIKSFTGLTHSVETRQKMAQSAIVRVRVLSEEAKQSIAAHNRARVVGDDTRARLKAAHTTPEALERTRQLAIPRMKAISVAGVVYESTHEAARQLGLSQGCVQYRVNSSSPTFKEWVYV